MTATNHALTGAAIGLLVGQFWLALPIALLSHFVCDSLPHYGNQNVSVGSKGFARYLCVDCAGAVVVATVLFALRPEHWFVACWCAFLATSPDLMWFGGFWKARRGAERSIPTYLLARFHASIQWFQRPIGAVVELVWGMSTIYLIANLI